MCCTCSHILVGCSNTVVPDTFKITTGQGALGALRELGAAEKESISHNTCLAALLYLHNCSPCFRNAFSLLLLLLLFRSGNESPTLPAAITVVLAQTHAVARLSVPGNLQRTPAPLQHHCYLRPRLLHHHHCPFLFIHPLFCTSLFYFPFEAGPRIVVVTALLFLIRRWNPLVLLFLYIAAGRPLPSF